MPVGSCFDLADKLQFSAFSDPVSLQTLLSTYCRLGFSAKDRLSLGVKLASSVIQLHQTWWLNTSWGKRDIVFFADPQTRDPLMAKPMVQHDLNSSPTILPPAQRQDVTCPKTKILFSLGVVLCELWLWRRLEDFCPDADPDSKLDYVHWSDNIKLLGIATLAYKNLQADAPPKYCEAVGACFFDNIPAESQEFTIAVWRKVVSPLEELLRLGNELGAF